MKVSDVFQRTLVPACELKLSYRLFPKWSRRHLAKDTGSSAHQQPVGSESSVFQTILIEFGQVSTRAALC